MNKIERVEAVLKHETVSPVPMGFWLHFPKETIQQGIDAQVEAHMQYAQDTDTDILKVMNENEMRSSEKVQDISDWKKIPRLNANSELVLRQKETLEKVLEKAGNDYYVIGTVHGIMASLSHASGWKYSQSPEIMNEHYKRDPQAIRDAANIIYENTRYMLEATMAAGVKGIYYAALGGESDLFSDEFHADVLAKPEINLLNEAKDDHNLSVFLHMCKPHVQLNRFKDYPSDVVNWAMNKSIMTFDEAHALFGDKVYLGGFDDRQGVLVDGTKEEIVAKYNEIKQTFSNVPYIIGADCTLPTDIDRSRVKFIHELIEQD